MKKLIAGAFFVSVALAGVSVAQAAPLAPVAQPDGIVTTVAGGCGPGYHRGPYGGCRRNAGAVVVAPGVVVAPAAPVVVRRACPIGYHLNRWGHCRPNY